MIAYCFYNEENQTRFVECVEAKLVSKILYFIRANVLEAYALFIKTGKDITIIRPAKKIVTENHFSCKLNGLALTQ